jgi:ribosomal protein L24
MVIVLLVLLGLLLILANCRVDIVKHISQREAMRLQREPGVMEKEMPLAVSNVMLADPKTGEPTRVGYRIEADGSKVRVAKKSGTVIDTVSKVSGDKTVVKKAAPKAAKTSTKAKSE